jgi:NAD(P) transhydrogenase subunit alpha
MPEGLAGGQLTRQFKPTPVFSFNSGPLYYKIERGNWMHPEMPSWLLSNLYILLLATFLGFEIIRRVSPLLHTPLMSLTNAISAIAVVGSILLAGKPDVPWYITALGTAAVAASMINIISGYMITYRMLKMFKKAGLKKP